MGQQSHKQLLLDRLIESGITPADDSAFEYLRIESGRPRFGHELTDGYIPLEANLWADVSFNKGCYTGQEIIARMESRGRIAKRLTLLEGDGRRSWTGVDGRGEKGRHAYLGRGRTERLFGPWICQVIHIGPMPLQPTSSLH